MKEKVLRVIPHSCNMAALKATDRTIRYFGAEFLKRKNGAIYTDHNGHAFVVGGNDYVRFAMTNQGYVRKVAGEVDEAALAEIMEKL